MTITILPIYCVAVCKVRVYASMRDFDGACFVNEKKVKMLLYVH